MAQVATAVEQTRDEDRQNTVVPTNSAFVVKQRGRATSNDAESVAYE